MSTKVNPLQKYIGIALAMQLPPLLPINAAKDGPTASCKLLPLIIRGGCPRLQVPNDDVTTIGGLDPLHNNNILREA